MVHEWSLEDSSLLDGERQKILFSQPLGLKTRTGGYSWLQDNKSNKNFAEIKVSPTLPTVLPNVKKIWAVPSSKTNLSAKSLKELAIERIRSRFDISNVKHFDNFVKTRSSCHLVEQVGKDFYCDCYEGMKGRYCKHSVGLMFKTETLEITSEVRSKPLGQKRRGCPKKLPACLTRSPQPDVPVSVYHPASPNVSFSISPTRSSAHPSASPPPPSTSTLNSPIESLTIVNKKRGREIETSPTFKIPPAKRKSRARKIVVDVEKRVTRSSRLIK